MENGIKRIRMMHLEPDDNKMKGDFNDAEVEIVTKENSKFGMVEKIFNYHLKQMTGLKSISNEKFAQVEMQTIELN
jgi:hypothetical protein